MGCILGKQHIERSSQPPRKNDVETGILLSNHSILSRVVDLQLCF